MSFVYVREISEIPTNFSADGGWVYLDTETFSGEVGDALDVMHNRLRLVSVFCGEGPAYLFDMLFLPFAPVWAVLTGKRLVGHNLAFDLAVLRRHGLPYPEECRDTLIGSQILCNGLPPAAYGHGLGDCVRRYLEQELVKDQGASDWSVPDLTPRQLEYAANDVEILAPLDTKLSERLEFRKLTKVYEIECGILPAIVDMKLTGVAVDRETWVTRSRKAEAHMATYEKQLLGQIPECDAEPLKKVRIKANGEPYASDVSYNARVEERNKVRKWNLASHEQLIEVFSRIGVRLPNTRYETLTEYRDAHPLLDLLLQWKDKEKEATTFGVEWLNHVGTDGRVHPDWRQLRAVSGRMACGDPNLQQIPRGECRNGIVAAPGNLLVRADFSQIEARVVAKISGDQVMLRLFQDPTQDIHRYAAQQVLEKDAVTPAERQIGKSLVFGLLFGMSAPSLRVYCKVNYGVKFTEVEAQIFRDRFFKAFPGLKTWHDKMRIRCRTMGEFRTLLGRRRCVFGTDTDLNLFGLSLNTPVQGTAADMMKASVWEVWLRRQEMQPFNLVMLVHDEIVLETPESRATDLGVWLRSIMIEVGNEIIDPVPVDASVKIGRTWGG